MIQGRGVYLYPFGRTVALLCFGLLMTFGAMAQVFTSSILMRGGTVFGPEPQNSGMVLRGNTAPYTALPLGSDGAWQHAELWWGEQGTLECNLLPAPNGITSVVGGQLVDRVVTIPGVTILKTIVLQLRVYDRRNATSWAEASQPGSQVLHGSSAVFQFTMGLFGTTSIERLWESFNVHTDATLRVGAEWQTVSSVNDASSGFITRMLKLPVQRFPSDGNLLVNAERHLAGGYRDPETGGLYPDLMPLDAAIKPFAEGGNFFATPTVNWDRVGGTVGNFSPGQTIPGLAANAPDWDHTASEIRGIVLLNAGKHIWGVNSDDGFRLSLGRGKGDVFGLVLGEYNGGRGATDSLFEFIVDKTGFYFLRCDWWNTAGESAVELFSVDPCTGQKILLNDRANARSVRVFQQGTGPAFCRGIAPAVNQSGVELMSPILITLVDDATTVNPGSISVSLSQQNVSHRTSKSGSVTTVVVDPPVGGYRPNTTYAGVFTFNGAQQPFSFTTTQLPTGTLFVEAEDFNFNSGNANPKAGLSGLDVNRMPYYGGAYDGLGAKSEIDYHESLVVTDGDVYRFGEIPNTPMILHQDFNMHFRESHFMSANYRIGWVGEGDWWNYTRTFPSGDYLVYAGLSDVAQCTGFLSRVLSNPAAANQSTEFLGTFGGPGSGNYWINSVLPLLDGSGSPVVLKLDGTATLRYTGVVGDADFIAFVPMENHLPGISNIPDQTTAEDRATAPIPVSVSDLDQPAAGLVLSASSSNSDLVGSSGFAFGGSAGARNLVITPLLNQTGTAVITVWVADRFGARVADQFVLTVVPVNDPPSLGAIAAQVTDEEAPFPPVVLQVADIDSPIQSMRFTGRAGDPTLIPDAQIVFDFNDGAWILRMTPASNRSGSTTVNVTLSDGASTAVRSFVATVRGFNDPPTISQIPDQTVEQAGITPLVPFVIGDPDTAASALTVSASSLNAALIPPANILLAGTGSNRTVQIRGPSSGTGLATVIVRVSDGSLSNLVRFNVTVTPRPRFDYGDAPDSYRTTRERNGPVHRIVNGLELGVRLDDEEDGQPDPGAMGDDNNPLQTGDVLDDEDGVTFSTIPIQGLLAGVVVQMAKFGFLDAWLDFNADGDFEDQGERILTRIPMTGGTTNLSFQIPPTAKLGRTFSRFRLTGAGIDQPFGPAPDGEVEDHELSIYPLLFDFGDAPEIGTSYPTSLVRTGAYHLVPPAPQAGGAVIGTHAIVIPTRLVLGRWIDDEADGQPSPQATGDDSAGSGSSAISLDDEDGIRFLTPLHPGTNATVEITLSTAGFVGGWIDFGRDGRWSEPGDMLFGEGLSLPGGVHQVQIFVPANAQIGHTFGRFRVSNLRQLILRPDGFGGLGEVEDHAVSVVPVPRCQNSCEGRSFVITFPGNYTPDPANPPRLRLCIAGLPETRGGVVIPALRFTNIFNFGGSRVQIVDLPQGAELGNMNDEVGKQGVFVFATQDVSIHAINTATNTSDGFLALPVEVLGTEYLVQGYANVHPGKPRLNGSQFAIVGTQSNTVVTIVPSVKAGLREAGVPYNITLNAGDTYQLRSTNDVPGDLSGTSISATAPIGVYGGHRCANINSSTTFFCDYVVEQLMPIRDFSKEFYTFPLAGRTGGDTFRMMASTDDTRVFVNGVQVALLDRGENHQRIIAGGAAITSDKPISVTQYANSSDYDGVDRSDPFMVNVIPTILYGFRHNICTGPERFTEHWVNVIVPEGARSLTRIDGSVIPFAEFIRIGTSSFYGVSKRVSQGRHTIDAPAFEGPGGSPITVTVYGWSLYDSYGWPGCVNFGDVSPPFLVPPTELTVRVGDPQFGNQGSNNVGCVFPLPFLGAAAQVSDACSSPRQIQVTQEPPAGTLLPPGVHTILLIATDPRGNVAREETHFTVLEDNSPIRLFCPDKPIVVECEDSTGAVVNYSVHAGNRCPSNVRIVCTPPPGSRFPVGRTVVTCRTEDPGLQLSCEFIVEVKCGNLIRTLDFTELEGGVLQLQWSAAIRGTLQSAPEVTGPWKSLPDARSPFVISPKQRREFFRFLPAQ